MFVIVNDGKILLIDYNHPHFFVVQDRYPLKSTFPPKCQMQLNELIIMNAAKNWIIQGYEFPWNVWHHSLIR